MRCVAAPVDFAELGVLVGSLHLRPVVLVGDAVLGSIHDEDGFLEVVLEESVVGQDDLVGCNEVGDKSRTGEDLPRPRREIVRSIRID